MSRLPTRVAPMLATLVDAPFHRPGWVWEEKYDGIRLIALKDGRHVRLLTRNDKDRTADFPEVVAAVAALPAPTLVLDGEVVVFDAGGVSRFSLLQRRAAGVSPPIYVVFDVLHASGQDLVREPLTARRARLEAEVREGPRLQVARRLAADGFEAFAQARGRGLEGTIGKDPASRYEPGVRSPAWCKVKVRAEDEFVIGGFTAPRGGRRHLGALLVGAWDGDALRYAGKVGTGFAEATLAALHRRLGPLARATSPFADPPRERAISWVEPRLVAQLAFTEMTGDGKLRHPVYLGLRDDKDARDVTWPGAPAVRTGASGEGSGGGARGVAARPRTSAARAPARAGATRRPADRRARRSRPRRPARRP
ncbi:MAG TPA: non-homologous end-joining DNA ligase [Methylomirabilota bacterium]|nr:non-homologous end-joining DNA ligase [Methylomirabilota bacterium]